MKLSPRVIAAVVLLLVVVVATVSANAGTTTPRKVRAYYTTGEAVPLPEHEETEVARLQNLRLGHYVVSAVVTVRNVGSGEMYISCLLVGDGISASGLITFGEENAQSQIALEGAGTLTTPGPIKVECQPGGGQGSATVHGLTALRVPVMDVQTP